MLNNLEGQSKAELIKIIEEQQAHDIKREAELKKAEVERDELGLLLTRFARSKEGKQFLHDNPVYEKASSLMRKRDIEQKIKGVKEFCETLRTYEDVYPIGDNHVTSLSVHRDSHIEQLCKEQENG